MSQVSKRMKKRLGKGWRDVLEEGKKNQLHPSSGKTEGGEEKQKEG